MGMLRSGLLHYISLHDPRTWIHQDHNCLKVNLLQSEFPLGNHRASVIGRDRDQTQISRLLYPLCETQTNLEMLTDFSFTPCALELRK